MGLTLKATITTASDGSATVYLPGTSGNGYSTDTGRLLDDYTLESITYTKTDFADGVDFAVTEQPSGITLWTGTNVNASTTVYPRAFVADAATGTVSTTVYDLIKIINGQIRVVVAAGGNAKTGTITVKLSG